MAWSREAAQAAVLSVMCTRLITAAERGCSAMLSGRRYRLELDSAQVELCEVFGDVCRSVWTGGEGRRDDQ